ncbi:hypothetical protein JKF63_03610 [Porcisia hertigi]|uniref:Methyltransferase n=1 Tax=Porcisia hertigi TaxID=2761500 RepID=A0A836ILM3_9TRYP|nr:hypothetical protein JKF63_03610 [Porcisia hertigi]
MTGCLPETALASCRVEGALPQSLILFLQGVPPKVVLSAFQSDCKSRDVKWCSCEAQMLAVKWFVKHPVVLMYPPRPRMVRALLKMYIASVEEQYTADVAVPCTLSEGPVQVDLMEEFIRLSVLGEASEQDYCFKTFYNPFVSVPGTHRITNASVASAPPSGLPMPQSANSSPSPSHSLSSSSSSLDSSRRASSPDMDMGSVLPSPSLHREPAHVPCPHSPPQCIVASEGLEDISSPAPSKRSPRQHRHPSENQPRQLTPDATTPVLAGAAATSLGSVFKEFSILRVSSEQFANVGLALWPAAFVMAQLLAQELRGQTHMLADVLGLPRAMSSTISTSAPSAPHRQHLLTTPAPVSSDVVPNCSPRISNSGNVGSRNATKPHNGRLRILELGAGAGLTPVYLHHMEEYTQHVGSFLATDYQEVIVDNMRFNMRENGIRLTPDPLPSTPGLDEGRALPLHRAAVLDWRNHDENERLFMTSGVDVILMADCIYDADVIPALVDTIHLALTVPGITSSTPEEPRSSAFLEDDGGASITDAPQKQRCCIVVQTHRQNVTMQRFFSAVRAFGDVRSYTLVRQMARSLRISKDYSGVDGDCIPLGGWDQETLLRYPDRMVCALMPDVILEDGRMRSASNEQLGNCANEAAATTGDHPTSHAPPATPLSTSLGTPGIASAVEDFAKPLPLSNSNSSMSSHVPLSRRTTVSPLREAAETLLADEMIGPFYTSMVGLIGVHVITLKPVSEAR